MRAGNEINDFVVFTNTGANIIEEKRRLIHVSGHASQEDIRIMTETARPRYVIPIHGEYRMLFRHKEYIKNHIEGFTDDNVILIENGDILELDERGARIAAHNELDRTFIDEEGSEEIEYQTVRERKKLAYGGAISLVVTIDKKTKEIVGEPQISYQGVANLDFANGFTNEAGQMIIEAISSFFIAAIASIIICPASFVKPFAKLILATP